MYSTGTPMANTEGMVRYLKLLVGMMWFFGCIAGGIYGAWWLWPTGITDIPLSNLTLAIMGKAAGSILAPWAGFAIAAIGVSSIDL